MRFKEKIAIVTGASRGIGAEIARRLAGEGARVVINHPGDEECAAQVVKSIEASGREAWAFKADVAEKSDVDAMVADTEKRYGRIDILVNNAGICPFNDFLSISEEEWDRVQAVNAKGIFLTSQSAAQVMKKNNHGCIVNVTSISGLKATNARQVAYCTSKAAANMLTKSLAVALAPDGIRVNAVLPGTVPTDINADVLADREVRENIISATPLGTLGAPADIASAVLFLASEEAKWITGSLLVVDGGWMA